VEGVGKKEKSRRRPRGAGSARLDLGAPWGALRLGKGDEHFVLENRSTFRPLHELLRVPLMLAAASRFEGQVSFCALSTRLVFVGAVAGPAGPLGLRGWRWLGPAVLVDPMCAANSVLPRGRGMCSGRVRIWDLERPPPRARFTSFFFCWGSALIHVELGPSPHESPVSAPRGSGLPTAEVGSRPDSRHVRPPRKLESSSPSHTSTTNHGGDVRFRRSRCETSRPSSSSSKFRSRESLGRRPEISAPIWAERPPRSSPQVLPPRAKPRKTLRRSSRCW